MAIHQFVDGRPQSGQRVAFGDGPPTAGTWKVGDIVELSPGIGATVTAVYPGRWRCVTAGTPGTWVADGSTINVGSAVASATTIAPTARVAHVTGTTATATITVPTGFPNGGTIILIPDGAWTWTNAGNIAVAGSAVALQAVHFTYDAGTTKWYPSNVA